MAKFPTDSTHAVRGIAALSVVISHTWGVFGAPLIDAPAISAVTGGLAVWSVAAFFCLSGMVIAVSMRARIERDGNFKLGPYLAARCWRILPPLAGAVLVTLLVVTLIQQFELYGSKSYWLPGDLYQTRDVAIFEWNYVLSTLTLTYNLLPNAGYLTFDGPLWSLSYEVWLYILAGLAAVAIVGRSWFGAIGTMLFAAFLLRYANPLFRPFMIVWGSGFVVGAAWGFFSRGIRTPATAFTFAILALAWGRERVPGLLANPYGDPIFYILFGLALCFALATALRLPVNSRIIGLPVTLGSFSYTLYLVHFPVLLFGLSLLRPFVVPYGQPGLLAIGAVSFAAALASSAALAQFLERRDRLQGPFRAALSVSTRTRL